MSTAEILSLLVIATLGHVMAGIWYAAYKGNWSICDRRIYDVPIQDEQLRRELKNSLHTPIHAVIGGLHLSGSTEKIIPETVADLRGFGLSYIAAGHCTGWRAVTALANAFGDAALVPLAVGKRLTF